MKVSIGETLSRIFADPMMLPIAIIVITLVIVGLVYGFYLVYKGSHIE